MGVYALPVNMAPFCQVYHLGTFARSYLPRLLQDKTARARLCGQNRHAYVSERPDIVLMKDYLSQEINATKIYRLKDSDVVIFRSCCPVTNKKFGIDNCSRQHSQNDQKFILSFCHDSVPP